MVDHSIFWLHNSPDHRCTVVNMVGSKSINRHVIVVQSHHEILNPFIARSEHEDPEEDASPSLQVRPSPLRFGTIILVAHALSIAASTAGTCPMSRASTGIHCRCHAGNCHSIRFPEPGLQDREPKPI